MFYPKFPGSLELFVARRFLNIFERVEKLSITENNQFKWVNQFKLYNSISKTHTAFICYFINFI